MYLFFDTETSGLNKIKTLPDDHPLQPRVVQFAAILAASPSHILRTCCFLVHPGNTIIPQAATDIHGITTEMARQNGRPLEQIVAIWHGLASTAHTLVAHNINFDLRTMRLAESQSNTLPIDLESKELVCTMNEAKHIVRATNAAGNIKQPKLAECVRFFFGKELEGAHDALNDARGCMEVFFKIQEQKEQEFFNASTET